MTRAPRARPHGRSGEAPRQRRGFKKGTRRSRVVTWAVVLVVSGLVVYGVSQMSHIAYDEDDIKVVNFSGLESARKNEVLEAANRARCTCGCGLGLAQCVSTDLTCPIRDSNIELIKGMVRQALASSPPS